MWHDVRKREIATRNPGSSSSGPTSASESPSEPNRDLAHTHLRAPGWTDFSVREAYRRVAAVVARGYPTNTGSSARYWEEAPK